jgi:hypothetical protein
MMNWSDKQRYLMNLMLHIYDISMIAQKAIRNKAKTIQNWELQALFVSTSARS